MSFPLDIASWPGSVVNQYSVVTLRPTFRQHHPDGTMTQWGGWYKLQGWTNGEDRH